MTAAPPPESAGGAAVPVPGGPGVLHTLIERLTAHYAETPFRADAVAGREEYFNRSGKVFEDDGALFERRLAAFQEWYLIERPLRDLADAGGQAAARPGRVPVLRALEGEGPGTFSTDERRALAALLSSHRSLFDIAAVDDRVVLLEDVVGGARFSVRERRSTVGFEVGDLVEARLVWDGDAVVFGRTMLFHPRDAREQVLGIVDHAGEKGQTRDDVLFLLSRLHVRWYRLGHVGAERVYREGLLR